MEEPKRVKIKLRDISLVPQIQRSRRKKRRPTAQSSRQLVAASAVILKLILIVISSSPSHAPPLVWCHNFSITQKPLGPPARTAAIAHLPFRPRAGSLARKQAPQSPSEAAHRALQLERLVGLMLGLGPPQAPLVPLQLQEQAVWRLARNQNSPPESSNAEQSGGLAKRQSGGRDAASQQLRKLLARPRQVLSTFVPQILSKQLVLRRPTRAHLPPAPPGASSRPLNSASGTRTQHPPLNQTNQVHRQRAGNGPGEAAAVAAAESRLFPLSRPFADVPSGAQQETRARNVPPSRQPPAGVIEQFHRVAPAAFGDEQPAESGGGGGGGRGGEVGPGDEQSEAERGMRQVDQLIKREFETRLDLNERHTAAAAAAAAADEWQRQQQQQQRDMGEGERTSEDSLAPDTALASSPLDRPAGDEPIARQPDAHAKSRPGPGPEAPAVFLSWPPRIHHEQLRGQEERQEGDSNINGSNNNNNDDDDNDENEPDYENDGVPEQWRPTDFPPALFAPPPPPSPLLGTRKQRDSAQHQQHQQLQQGVEIVLGRPAATAANDAVSVFVPSALETIAQLKLNQATSSSSQVAEPSPIVPTTTITSAHKSHQDALATGGRHASAPDGGQQQQQQQHHQPQSNLMILTAGDRAANPFARSQLPMNGQPTNRHLQQQQQQQQQAAHFGGHSLQASERQLQSVQPPALWQTDGAPANQLGAQHQRKQQQQQQQQPLETSDLRETLRRLRETKAKIRRLQAELSSASERGVDANRTLAQHLDQLTAASQTSDQAKRSTGPEAAAVAAEALEWFRAWSPQFNRTAASGFPAVRGQQSMNVPLGLYYGGPLATPARLVASALGRAVQQSVGGSPGGPAGSRTAFALPAPAPRPPSRPLRGWSSTLQLANNNAGQVQVPSGLAGPAPASQQVDFLAVRPSSAPILLSSTMRVVGGGGGDGGELAGPEPPPTTVAPSRPANQTMTAGSGGPAHPAGVPLRHQAGDSGQRARVDNGQPMSVANGKGGDSDNNGPLLSLATGKEEEEEEEGQRKKTAPPEANTGVLNRSDFTLAGAAPLPTPPPPLSPPRAHHQAPATTHSDQQQQQQRFQNHHHQQQQAHGRQLVPGPAFNHKLTPASESPIVIVADSPPPPPSVAPPAGGGLRALPAPVGSATTRKPTGRLAATGSRTPIISATGEPMEREPSNFTQAFDEHEQPGQLPAAPARATDNLFTRLWGELANWLNFSKIEQRSSAATKILLSSESGGAGGSGGAHDQRTTHLAAKLTTERLARNLIVIVGSLSLVSLVAALLFVRVHQARRTRRQNFSKPKQMAGVVPSGARPGQQAGDSSLLLALESQQARQAQPVASQQQQRPQQNHQRATVDWRRFGPLSFMGRGRGAARKEQQQHETDKIIRDGTMRNVSLLAKHRQANQQQQQQQQQQQRPRTKAKTPGGAGEALARPPAMGRSCCHCVSCSESWLFRDARHQRRQHTSGDPARCSAGLHQPGPRGKLPFGAASSVNNMLQAGGPTRRKSTGAGGVAGGATGHPDEQQANGGVAEVELQQQQQQQRLVSLCATAGQRAPIGGTRLRMMSAIDEAERSSSAVCDDSDEWRPCVLPIDDDDDDEFDASDAAAISTSTCECQCECECERERAHNNHQRHHHHHDQRHHDQHLRKAHYERNQRGHQTLPDDDDDDDDHGPLERMHHNGNSSGACCRSSCAASRPPDANELQADTSLESDGRGDGASFILLNGRHQHRVCQQQQQQQLELMRNPDANQTVAKKWPANGELASQGIKSALGKSDACCKLTHVDRQSNSQSKQRLLNGDKDNKSAECHDKRSSSCANERPLGVAAREFHNCSGCCDKVSISNPAAPRGPGAE